MRGGHGGEEGLHGWPGLGCLGGLGCLNEIEAALAAEVPEIVGPMKALGIDKKLKSWVESRVDGLINQGIEQLMGSGWGSGAMLPGAGAMLPGSGAMLPGSGSGLYNVTDHMQHPSLRNSFHPSMLRRAR